MKEKTAVEWLVEQICGDHTKPWQKEIEQAKEMEKEQSIIILKKYHNSLFLLTLKGDEAESIYNHIVDTNEMILDKVLFEQAIKAMEEHYGSGCESEIDAYFRGAKWMQKQFKQQEQ